MVKIVDGCMIVEDEESLHGQVKGRRKGWSLGEKAKTQLPLALMLIAVPSLPACYMRTCNVVSRRWDALGHFVMGT